MTLAKNPVVQLHLVLVLQPLGLASSPDAAVIFKEALGRVLDSEATPKNHGRASKKEGDSTLVLTNAEGDLKVTIAEEKVDVVWRAPSDGAPTLGDVWDSFAQLAFLTANALKEKRNAVIRRVGMVIKMRVKVFENPVSYMNRFFLRQGVTGNLPEEMKIHFRHAITLGRFPVNRWIMLSADAVEGGTAAGVEVTVDLNTPAEKELDLNENQVRRFLHLIQEHWKDIEDLLE